MNNKKLAVFEVIFFIFYFIILPVTRTFEYQLKTPGGNQLISAPLVVYYIVSGFLTVIPYYIFYETAVKKLFIRKKYGLFILCIILLIFVMEFYLRAMDSLLSWPVLFPEAFVSIARSFIKKAGFLRQNISVTITHLISLSAIAFFIQTIKEGINFLKLKEQHTLLELEQLKAQIQPHFFFNTLNNIYSLSLEKSDNTPQTVVQLSELMRYIIYDCQHNTVPLEKELRFLENYVGLEKIRHENMDIIFEKELNNTTIEIEPLLFIPIIENAFKHSPDPTNPRAFIHIYLAVINREIILQVKNSKGRELKKTGGIGLNNVKKRLDLLYRQQYTLAVDDRESEFEVYLSIKLPDEKI